MSIYVLIYVCMCAYTRVHVCIRSVMVQLLPKTRTKTLVFSQCLKLQVFGEKEKKKRIF